MANQNVVSMKSLLEAGVHFGHQTRRWNPSGSTAFTNPEKMNDAAKRKRHVFATTS